MKKHLEVKTIEHKGIKVTVAIDYDRGTASFVEHKFDRGWDDKKFVFSRRELPYMNGWLNILEAMSVAVKECKKELEIREAEIRKEKDGMNLKMMKLISSTGEEYVNREKKNRGKNK